MQQDQNKYFEVHWNGRDYVLDLNGVSFIVDASLVAKKAGTTGFIPQTIKNSAAFHTTDSALARIVPFGQYETRLFDLGKDDVLDPQKACGYALFINKNGECLISGPASELDKISVRSAADPRLSSEARREMELLRRQANDREYACRFYPPAGTTGYQLQNLAELLEEGQRFITDIRHLKEVDAGEVKYKILEQQSKENTPGRKFLREAFEQGARVTSGNGHARLLIPREPTEKSVWHEDSFDDLSVPGIYRRLTDAVGTELSGAERLKLAQNLYQTIFYSIGDNISPPDGRAWKDVGLHYLRQIFYYEQGGKRSPSEVAAEARKVVEDLKPIAEYVKLQEKKVQAIEETGERFAIESATASSISLSAEGDLKEVEQSHDFDDLEVVEQLYDEPDLQARDREADYGEAGIHPEWNEFTPAEFRHYSVVDSGPYAIFPNLVAQQDEDSQQIDLENYEKELASYVDLVRNVPFAQLELSAHLRRYLAEVWGYGSKRADTAEELRQEALRNLSVQVERHLQLKLTPEQVGILGAKEDARLEALVGASVLMRAVSYQAGLNKDRAQLLGALLAASVLLNEAKTVYGEARLEAQLNKTLALNPALQKAALSWPLMQQYIHAPIQTDPTQKQSQEQVSLGVGVAAPNDIKIQCSNLSVAYQLHLETERVRRFVGEILPLTQALATAASAQSKEPGEFWRSINQALEQVARQHGVPEDFTAFVRRQAQSQEQIALPALTDDQRRSLQQRLLAATKLSEERDTYPNLEELRPVFNQLSAQTPLVSLRLPTQTNLFAAKTSAKDAQQKCVLTLNPTDLTPQSNDIAQIFSAFRSWMRKYKEDYLAHLKPHERQKLFETVSVAKSLQPAYNVMIQKGIPAHHGREVLNNFYREGIDEAAKKTIDAKRRLVADPQYQQIKGEIDKAAGEKRENRLSYLAGMFGGHIIPTNPQDRELLKQYQALCFRIPQARGEIFDQIKKQRQSLSPEYNKVQLKEEQISRTPGARLHRELNNHPFVRLFNGIAQVETLRQQTSRTDQSAHAKQIAAQAAAGINSQSIRESVAKILENGDALDRQIAEGLRNPAYDDTTLLFSAPPVNVDAEISSVHRIVGLVVNPERLNVHEPGQALAERARLAEALGQLNVHLNQMAHTAPESPTFLVNQAQRTQSLQKAAAAYDQLRTLKTSPPDEDAAVWLYNKVFTTPAKGEIIENPLFRQVAEQAKRSYEHNCAYHLGGLLEQAYVQGSFARAERIAAANGEDTLAKELRSIRQIVENPAQAPQKSELVLSQEAREAYLVSGIGQACRSLIPHGWQPRDLPPAVVEAYAQQYVARLATSAKINPLPEDREALIHCVAREIVVKNDFSHQAAALETYLVSALQAPNDQKLQTDLSKKMDTALQKAVQCSTEAQNLALERQQLTDQLMKNARYTDDREAKQNVSDKSHFVK